MPDHLASLASPGSAGAFADTRCAIHSRRVKDPRVDAKGEDIELARPPVRVLVVDDSEFMRMTVKKLLPPGRFEVCGEASTGAEALAAYARLHPDMVTLDITMPDMTGIEALRAITSLDPEARILMCTANHTPADVVNAMRAGARDYVAKPFKTDRFLEALDRVMA